MLTLPDGVFTLLRDMIHDQCGLHYEAGKRDLFEYKLAPRVSACGLGSFLDYYYFLREDPAASHEWQLLLDALTIQETFFWREGDALRALTGTLLPNWAASNPGAPLRIWCAACATGEEPLSIAIALSEAGWFARSPIEIVASDISQAALSQAQRGIYRERSFRALPAALQARYFSATAAGWQVAPELHARVRWVRANVCSEADVAPLANAPFIFCRNLFIYFSRNAMRKTAELFARCMPATGYLFLGVAESLVRVSEAFELQEIDRAFVYVKSAAGAR